MTHAKRMIPTAAVQVKHIGLFGGVVHGIELNRNKGDRAAGPAHENLGTLRHAGDVGNTGRSWLVELIVLGGC